MRILRNLLVLAITFLSGVAVGNIPRQRSVLIELVETNPEASEPPIFCALGEMSSIKSYLTDDQRNSSIAALKTLDDENLVLLRTHNSMIYLKFTTFEFSLKNLGCMKLAR